MTYLPTMGAIDASNFNDTKFPGSVYARNPITHALFEELQRQLNRAAYARKLSTRLAVDGKIGEGTRALAKTIGFSNTDSLRSVALNADSLAVGAKAIADSAGVGATVPAPKPASPPMMISPTTDALVPAPSASIMDAFKNMSMPMMLALGAAAVGVGYYLTKKPKSNPAKARRRQPSTVVASPGARKRAERQRYLARLYKEERPKWIRRRGKEYVALNPSRRSR